MYQIHLPPSPAASSPATRASMKGNKSVNTKPEWKLTKMLGDAGITGFVINHQELPGTPDVAFMDAKISLFMHGCFWHRCPYCKPHFPESNKQYWEVKFARNKLRDIQVRKELRQMRWKPIVIWECQLIKNPRRVLSRIINALKDTHA